MSKQFQQDRITRATAAVEAYAAASGGGSIQEVVSDMLADLMHYADWCPTDALDFSEALDTGHSNYIYEKEEDNA